MQCQQGNCRHHYEGQGYYNYPLLNYATFNGFFTLAVLEGGKVQWNLRLQPPLIWMCFIEDGHFATLYMVDRQALDTKRKNKFNRV